MKIALNPDTIQLSGVVVTSENSYFDVESFVVEAIEKYNSNRRRSPHVAFAYFREKAKVDGHYALFNESQGFSIYMGDNDAWTPMSLFKFYCANTRVAHQSESWERIQVNSSAKGMIGGSINLNLFKQFETYGLLANSKVPSYTFKLDSSYINNHRRIYSIHFGNGREKGIIRISDDLQIRSIEFEARRRLWSIPLQRRVNGKALITFSYFDGVPFVSEISSFYRKENLIYWNNYIVILQKLNDFDISEKELASLNHYDANPYISYDPEDWSLHPVPIDQDYEAIQRDMLIDGRNLETQFRENSGSWYFSKRNEGTSPKKAQEKIKELKRFF